MSRHTRGLAATVLLLGQLGVVPVLASSAAQATPAAATAGPDCSALAQSGGSCLIEGAASQPQQVTLPAGVPSVLTAVVSGGSGGTGRLQAGAGAGGVTVARLSVQGGQTLAVYVGGQAANTSPGVGYSPGGPGGSAPSELQGHDGGAGGGSSAVVVVGHSGPAVVAGGGGGGGGNADVGSPGGVGGSGGSPASAGRSGKENCPTRLVFGGTGGSGSGASGSAGSSGGQPDVIQGSAGGGGGGGYPKGGGSGHQGGAGTIVPGAGCTAGGGGGGGGSFVGDVAFDPHFGAGHVGDGSVLLVASTPVAFSCGGPSTFTLATGTDRVFALVAGGGGAPGSSPDTSQAAAGAGAVVTATLDTGGQQSLDIYPGCAGRGHEGGNSTAYGGQGGTADVGSFGNGGGGGGASWVSVSRGALLLGAGGGGGGGGGTNHPGGAGGDAGLAFGPDGAGSTPSTAFYASGGCGGCAYSGSPDTPVTYGIDGTGANYLHGGAGGGGGGGFPAGGWGGDHGVTGIGTGGSVAGGGGGAGSSYRSAEYAAQAQVTPGNAGDGYVLLVPLGTLHTGLTVTATSTGAGAAQYGAGPFTEEVTCTYAGQQVYSGVLTLAAGGSTTVPDLLVGASCTVTETGPAGSDPVPAPQTLTLAYGVNHVTMANTFALAPLTISVTSSAPNGYLVAPASFTVLVSCTLGGRAIALPDGGAYPAVQDAALDPVVVTVPSVPVGSQCSVLEDTDRAVVLSGSASSPNVPSQALPVVVTTTASTRVTLSNAYVLGSVQLSKRVTGTSAPPAGTTYGIAMSCTIAGQPTTVLPTGAVLANGQTATVQALAGALCTADETSTAGATSTTYTPARSVTVLPVVSVDLGVTNDFSLSSLAVSVTLSGAAAGHANQPFQAQVSCSGQQSYLLTFPASGGPSETPLPALPVGTTCRVTETNTGGATAVGYRVGTGAFGPSAPTVTIGSAPTAVTIDNRFDAGPVVLVTRTVGPGAPYANQPTVLQLSCSLNNISVYAGQLTFAAQGGVHTVTGLPLGSRCLMEPVSTGGATSTSFQVTNGGNSINNPPIFFVEPRSAQGPTTVTTTNTFAVAALSVTKTIAGDAAGQANAPSSSDVSCTFGGRPLDSLGPDGVVRLDFDVAGRPVPSAGWDLLRSLPVGAACRSAEHDAAGASRVTYETSAPGGTSTGSVVVKADGTARLTTTLYFDAADVTVRTAAAGNAPVPAEPRAYLVELACRLNGKPVLPTGGATIVRLTDGGSHTFAGLPRGAVCRVSELGSAGATRVEPGADQTVTLAAAHQTATFTNVFDVAPVAVEGRVSGPGAALYASDVTFAVGLDCARQVGRTWVAVGVSGGAVTLPSPDYRATVPAVPVGLSCRAFQPDAGIATTVRQDPPLLVTPGGPNVLRIEDVIDVSTLTVSKQTVGDAPSGVFGFRVLCTVTAPGPRTAVTPHAGSPANQAFSLVAGGSTDLTVPAYSSCAVTETDARGAVSTRVTTPSATSEATSATVRTQKGDTLTVAYVNTFGSSPAVPATAAAEPTSGSGLLPRTGSDAGALAFVGFALVLLGAGLVVVRRVVRAR